jgi:transcriptional regulator GlxA family with amidase domain
MSKQLPPVERRASAIDRRVRAVIEIIERDFAQRIDWRRVSASVGLSRSGLRLLFKQNTGEAPSGYLRRLRFERARDLLCQKADKSVKEIMALTGFSDESHFVRDFKNRYGKSPRKYRMHHFGVKDADQLAKRPTR